MKPIIPLINKPRKHLLTMCEYSPQVFPFQESVTDYTAPSSSLADSVPTGGNKIEESLVANVSTHLNTGPKCFVVSSEHDSHGFVWCLSGGATPLIAPPSTRDPAAELKPQHRLPRYC